MSKLSAPERTSFNRIEKKFVLSRDVGEELLREIAARVPPSYPKDGTRYYDVESLYFDSLDLDIFRSHFRIYDGRFKLRTRTYGPNGIWDRSQVYLEMKMKKNEVTEKFRIKLDPSSHSALFESESPELALSRSLVMINNTLEFRELSQRIQKIDQNLRKHGLRPCTRLHYRRKAFESPEIRITLDENIRSELLMDVNPETRMEIFTSPIWPEALRMQSEHPLSGGMILEIKNQGTLPGWLSDFFKTKGITEARFSKFCHSVISNLSGVMGAPLSRAEISPVFRSVSE